MPQLSLYLDDETMETLRHAADAEQVSMSKYAAGLIRDRAQRGGWPQGYWERVYGCIGPNEMRVTDDGLDAALDDACDWAV